MILLRNILKYNRYPTFENVTSHRIKIKRPPWQSSTNMLYWYCRPTFVGTVSAAVLHITFFLTGFVIYRCALLYLYLLNLLIKQIINSETTLFRVRVDFFFILDIDISVNPWYYVYREGDIHTDIGLSKKASFIKSNDRRQVTSK